jgi:Ca2+-binding RTX toxin-like protein
MHYNSLRAPKGNPMLNNWIEPLEDRLVLSAPIITMPPAAPRADVSLRGGILQINGSSGNDRITLSVSHHSTSTVLPFQPADVVLIVKINGKTWSFDAADVGRIRINGGAGNDRIQIQSPPKFSWDDHCNRDLGPSWFTVEFPLMIDGGAGNDTIVGGELDDTIHGGAGNDSIMGMGGADHLFGDAGNDQLIGGADDDTLDGGDGADLLAGEVGNDSLIGHGGSDSIYGGKGDDRLIGGNGSDSMWGEEGTDEAWGGSGSDAADTVELPRKGIEKAAEPIFWVCEL